MLRIESITLGLSLWLTSRQFGDQPFPVGEIAHFKNGEAEPESDTLPRRRGEKVENVMTHVLSDQTFGGGRIFPLASARRTCQKSQS